MTENICPLLSIASISAATTTRDAIECLGDYCAWWDCLAGSCCIAAAANGICAAMETKEADL